MSTPSKSASLAKHYSRYALGNVLSLLAGFVSFPITTRLLTNEQFGVLGYWEVWVLVLVALLKFGAGETMMRFYPHGQDPSAQVSYGTNFIVVPCLIALGAWSLLMLGLGATTLFGHVEQPMVVALAFGTLLTAVWSSHLSWIMATRELSGLNATVNVVWRWLTVAVTLAILTQWLPSASGVFLARLLVGLAVLAWSLRWVRGVFTASRDKLDWPRVREGLAYGVPLALKEVSNIILVLINRVMLKWLGGDYALVGIYTIGFSLAMYLDQIISTALSQAFNPMATRLYATEGAAGVVRAKRRMLPLLVYACVGLAAGVVAGGHDFIAVVASADKLASAPIFIIAGVALLTQPIISIAGFGLLLEKRSRTVFALTAVAAIFNVGLNYLLIPAFSLIGATAAVCTSQILLQLCLYAACPRELRCAPPWRPVALALLLASLFLGLWLASAGFGLTHHWARLVAAAGALLVLYLVPLVLIDPTLRNLARSRLLPGRA